MNELEISTDSHTENCGFQLSTSITSECSTMTFAEKIELFPKVTEFLSEEDELQVWLLLLDAKSLHHAGNTPTPEDFPHHKYSYWDKTRTGKDILLVRSLNNGEQLDFFWVIITRTERRNSSIEVSIEGWLRSVLHGGKYRYSSVIEPHNDSEQVTIGHGAEVYHLSLMRLKAEQSLNEIDQRLEAVEWLGLKLSNPKTFENIGIGDFLDYS